MLFDFIETFKYTLIYPKFVTDVYNHFPLISGYDITVDTLSIPKEIIVLN